MANGSNFFQNIISSIFGSNDPEVLKKKQLKNIAKDLSKSKYHFYKYNVNQVDPSFAKFIYDIYKAIAPAQVLFQNANTNTFKNVVIRYMMDEKASELLEGLDENVIARQASTMPIKELQHKVRLDLEGFLAQFDSAKIRQGDDLFNKLIIFDSFCKFDFYYMLKKFDGLIKERNFELTPHFNPVSGAYLSEDIKNFIAVAWALPFDDSWDELFKLLKKMNSVEPVPLNVWKKILSRLKPMRDRHILEMIVRLITEKPDYREHIRVEEYHIMEEYLGEIKRQVEHILENIKEQQTTGKIDTLLPMVFSDPVPELVNYNDENSEPFRKKGFRGFLYCDPLRYLNCFLNDYSKKELREFADILLVRGEWSNQQKSVPMSDAYHKLLSLSTAISEFDKKVAESGEYGLRLKTHLPRSDRDKEAASMIKMILGDVNDEAGEIILEASQNYVIFGRNLKMCIEDFAKAPRSELILNWKDLDKFAEGNLKQKSVSVYKKLFNFVQLMQNFQVIVNEKSSARR
ncbi:MAG: hypothetical protein IKI40_01955 [Treponema sp.]|nr:hypothetical protein [Treponema sp.]